MAYDLDRLNGDDPTYAPGMFRAKDLYYWRPAPHLVKAGYRKDQPRLVGRDGDGRDLERAAQCRDFTREMLRWEEAEDRAKAKPGTWGWLIGRYKADDVSPFQEVKANTRADYRFSLDRWQEAIGDVGIADTDYTTIKRWEKAMIEKGRSLHYIKSMFTKLRIVAGYGIRLEVKRASEVKAILSEMRFRAAPPRTVYPTEAQVMAIVAEADRAGQGAYATGLLLQWWLTLRAVDVRGQFLDGRWADGLTWDMIDRDITTLRKVASKTAKTAPQAMEFDLMLLPDVRARLQAIPKDQRIGPVIKKANGQPFTKRHWSALFATFRTAAGVPDEVCMMDVRAGAINHAREAGASMEDRQRQAQHASPSTTEIYTRGHDEVRNRVIKLRTGQ